MMQILLAKREVINILEDLKKALGMAKENFIFCMRNNSLCSKVNGLEEDQLEQEK